MSERFTDRVVWIVNAGEPIAQAMAKALVAEGAKKLVLSGVESESIGVYELENGGECAKAFLAMKHRPTGFVAINDMTAIGAMRVFTAAGVRIPEDISMVGFDNIPYCELCMPPLTTVNQHAYELGALAVRKLLDQSSREGALLPELVVRGSCRAIKG